MAVRARKNVGGDASSSPPGLVRVGDISAGAAAVRVLATSQPPESGNTALRGLLLLQAAPDIDAAVRDRARPCGSADLSADDPEVVVADVLRDAEAHTHAPSSSFVTADAP